MEIESKQLADKLEVIYLSGELDSFGLRRFKQEIREAVAQGNKTIIVDCKELGFISSSGLAALLWARGTANRHGARVYLTHVSATVNSVLEVTRLSRLLAIEPTTRDLLERLGRLRKTQPKLRRRRSLASKIRSW